MGSARTCMVGALAVLGLMTEPAMAVGTNYQPKVGLAKAAGEVTANSDGTFSVPVDLVVQNVGNEKLKNVRVMDDLAAAIEPARLVGVSHLESTLTTNPHFDGEGDTDLLSGTDRLGVNQQGSISFILTFDADGHPGPFFNTAATWAKGKFSHKMVDDVSQNGPDTDPDTPGLGPEHNPHPGDDSEPTPITLPIAPPHPAVGLAKAADPSRALGDGTFETTLRLTIQNVGNEKLKDVQIVDKIAEMIAPATLVSVSPVRLLSGGLSANPQFDGVTSTGVLAAGQHLGVGQQAVVAFDLRFDPGSDPGPFFNSAATWAKGRHSHRMVDDVSQNGDDTDPDTPGLQPGDNPHPGDDSEPTPIELPAVARVIGLAKQAGPVVVSTTDEAFEVDLVLRAENLGDVDVAGVQIIDDLTETFPAPATFTVLSVASPTLTVNGRYDGSADSELLTGGDVLDVGAAGQVSIQVAFSPNGAASPFLNRATASADGAPVDESHDGDDPDPEGDGPADNNTPTPIVFDDAPVTPIIGLAKAAATAVETAPGIFTTDLTFTLANAGTVVLDGIQVTDDLAATFADATSFRVLAIDGDQVAVNTLFNGVDDLRLLGGDDSLAVGASAQIVVSVEFAPGSAESPFLNRASATARTPDTASDASHNGLDPDPDGDGPANDDDPTPIPFEIAPDQALLGLAKAATDSVISVDSLESFETTLTFTARNYGTAPLAGLQITDNLALSFPPPATFEVLSVTSDTLTVNTDYDGTLQPNVLSGIDVLPGGATGTVALTVGFSSNGDAGPFFNTAIASTNTPGVVPDSSHDGGDPDPEGDGPADNDTPTPIIVPTAPVPAIGLAKAANDIALTVDGNVRARLTLVVQNPGEEALTNLQVTDSLAGALAPGVVTDVRDLVVIRGDVGVNPAFDGDGDAALLAPGQTLDAGAEAVLEFTVEIDPGDNAGPFFNTATASGVGDISGQAVEDTSTDGLDTDPDTPGLAPGDNPEPGDDSEPTPIEVPVAERVIGLAKRADPAIVATSTTGEVFEVELILRAENLGTVSLAGVQIVDNLAETFPAPASFTVQSVSSATLTVNGQYDGIDDDELLTGSDVLAPGASAEIAVRVAFSPNGATSPFFNSATVSADGAATDVSHDGEDSDPEGDGPGDNSTPTPIEFDDIPAAAFLGLAKAASEPVRSADSSQTFETILTFTARNYGDAPLAGVQITDNLAATFPPPATFEVLAVSSETLALNPGFDGGADPNVLSGIDELLAGATGTVAVTVGFSPNGEAGPFFNTAIVSTTTPGVVPDSSHDGGDPDPEGDG
ncbi:MAG: hypothetical protein OES38_03140, partial [Gammaproteobacteria bacterium]|nr:hypothetical protein [Gammaproteobacteria bacterium]